MTTLSDFLSREQRFPWKWGEKDCTLWVADWLAACRGVDPAAAFRGAYASEAECNALLEREGGLIKLTRRVLRAHGFRRATSAKAGDIGLVRVPVLERGQVVTRPANAICVAPDRWVVRTIDKGLVIAPMPLIVSWSV